MNSKKEDLNFLKNVTAIDQDKYEFDLLSKVDKAYKDSITKEKDDLKNELNSIRQKINEVNAILSDLRKSYLRHIESSRVNYVEFEKIRNYLNNQINSKKNELIKLEKIGKRTEEKLKSFKISENVSEMLSNAGTTDENYLNNKKENDEDCKDTKPETIEISDDSDAASDVTMVYDLEEEGQIDGARPQLIRKRTSEKFQIDEEITNISNGQIPKKRCVELSYKDDSVLDNFRTRLNNLNEKETPFEELGSDFRLPKELWDRLFEFQKHGVRWLLQLHNQCGGGILGDEMGLGKTVQLLAFFTGLFWSQSSLYKCSPCVVVCPATVLRQWLDASREWAPWHRCVLLHQRAMGGSGNQNPSRLMDNLLRHQDHSPTLLITTYSGLVQNAKCLAHLLSDGGYLVLDEGHKIKNPNTKVTQTAKELWSNGNGGQHRIILSGSPLQNNLRELWSLVDFVSPGRLGTLSSFQQNVALPIVRGGYQQATPLQVETSYRCACVLRDALSGILLRRTKAQVRIQLPRKSEQVLFCGLSTHQVLVYREFLSSKLCSQILSRQTTPFSGLIMLRKICNHPDLVTGGPNCTENHPLLGFAAESNKRENRFGHWSRSGKMQVVRELLTAWRQDVLAQHKVLLFTQGRQTLLLLSRLLRQEGWPYLTMHGSTPVSQRPEIVRQFSELPAERAFVFLLTTRVGGLGLNLTAADRVLLFDPDWNPSTDLQARERAWRIGQIRPVIVYRLVCSGTLEEHIYHRQVFKTFLTNRVLKNPRQRRFFKTQELRDLFRFEDKSGNRSETDTSLMLRGTGYFKKLNLSSKKGCKSNYFDEADENKLKMMTIDNDDDDNDQYNESTEVKTDDIDEEVEILDSTDAHCDFKADNLQKGDVEDINENENEEDEVELEHLDLEKLRKKAKKLSRALGKLQQQENTTDDVKKGVKVDGFLIKNVRDKKEYNGISTYQDEAIEIEDSAVVQNFVNEEKRRQITGLLNNRERAKAEQMAEEARRYVFLASAGVQGVVEHSALIGEAMDSNNRPNDDHLLLEQEADKTAAAALSWLRHQILETTGDMTSECYKFGSVKNVNLWNPKEETNFYRKYTEGLLGDHTAAPDTKFHFTNQNERERYSSRLMLVLFLKRRISLEEETDGACSNGSIADNAAVSETMATLMVSSEIRQLTEQLYRYLSKRVKRGPVSSTKLIGHFRTKVRPVHNVTFKRLLTGMCCQRVDLQDGWLLRPEFQKKYST